MGVEQRKGEVSIPPPPPPPPRGGEGGEGGRTAQRGSVYPLPDPPPARGGNIRPMGYPRQKYFHHHASPIGACIGSFSASVEALATELSAACSVCQGRIAPLTRVGRARAPAKTA